jgi:hypothetical protein
MTKQEAKELCLEVWGHLRDHPEIEEKEKLPEYLYNRIKFLESRCPLCHINPGCFGCPLYTHGGCIEKMNAFYKVSNILTMAAGASKSARNGYMIFRLFVNGRYRMVIRIA